MLRFLTDYGLVVVEADRPDRSISSGRTDRHRLHRGGDRDANRALLAHHPRPHALPPATKDYVTRRTAEGKTKTEIMRCLKRYIARDLPPARVATSGPGILAWCHRY